MRFFRCVSYSVAACWAAGCVPAQGQVQSAAERRPCPSCASSQAAAHLNPNLTPLFADSLAAAIADAYAQNPDLLAKRYDLRALDDELGIALATARPSARIQITGGYDWTKPGDITQASRSLSDRLNNPNIERNSVSSEVRVDQPLWTGGRATSAYRASSASSAAGREALRGAEGDLVLDLVGTYLDVRRDSEAARIRADYVSILREILTEVAARREAGELTLTDTAQTETQLKSAEVQLTIAEAQLQASRAAYAAIVGREPGRLTAPPQLPGIPTSLDDAFLLAQAANPELAAAIANERASRARIDAARAEGRPELGLSGTVSTNGPAVPFDRHDHDLTFSGRTTLTIPLFAGGRVRSQVAQARNRNTADGLRVAATERRVVQAVVNAWNQWAAAERNRTSQLAQLEAAQIFLEGALAEYREGLRSTFDVLFAQSSLREAEIGFLANERDSYFAQAALLRHTGRLDAQTLLSAPVLYDPEEYAKRARMRSAVPWAGLIRTLDSIGAPRARAGPPLQLPPSKAAMVTPELAANPPPVLANEVSPKRLRHASPLAPLPKTKRNRP